MTIQLILGICLSFPKIGSALNNYLSPIFAQHFHSDDPDNYSDMGMPMIISFFLMVFGLVCSLSKF